MNEGALAKLDVDAAISAIANGAKSREIAERYGVTSAAVRNKLREAKPEAYKAAVAAQVEHWVFDSADEMDGLPCDTAAINRARARADFRLKLAGKLNPLYADKSQVTHDISEDFAALLQQISQRRQGRVIEHVAETPIAAALQSKVVDSVGTD